MKLTTLGYHWMKCTWNASDCILFVRRYTDSWSKSVNKTKIPLYQEGGSNFFAYFCSPKEI